MWGQPRAAQRAVPIVGGPQRRGPAGPNQGRGTDASGRAHWAIRAAREGWRRWHGRGLRCPATRACAAQGGDQTDQGWHGFASGGRALRGRTAGVGHDGSPQHGQGARRGQHRRWPAVFRDGVYRGCADPRLLRRTAPSHQGATAAVRDGVSRDSARPPEGHHPSRHQAQQRASGGARRRAVPEGHRLRYRQSDPQRCFHGRGSNPASSIGRHADVHEPRTGGHDRAGHRYAQ